MLEKNKGDANRLESAGVVDVATARKSLLPFRPGVDGPWDAAAAAHLMRRAAFGAPPERLAPVNRLEPRAAAASLLEAPPEDDDDLRFLADTTRRLGNLEGVQGWWVYRMLLGKAPARDKLALFWHGHFATSDDKVDDPRLMMRQIELFQKIGSGPFGVLLLEMARDAAMLIWLDGNSNRRGKPNENFARELMELFSLGIGNYTEDDIKEAARAFTGWHVRRRAFWFNSRAHDRGIKKVFGREGNFGGEDVVRLCLEKTACSEFVAGKLFEYYVAPSPPAPLRRVLGETLESCGKNVGDFLATLWSSRLFFSKEVRRALVSTPVDHVVGSLATLGGTANTQRLAKTMAAMGQDLLRPPSVKGWDGGLTWLNSNTLLARYRFAAEITRGGGIEAKVPWEEIEAEAVDRVVARFFPDGLADEIRAALVGAAGGEKEWLVAGCLQLPEYQYI